MAMFSKIIVVAILLAIIGSLFSALFYMYKDHDDPGSTRMVKALAIRVGLSISLFLLLGLGFYFDILKPG